MAKCFTVFVCVCMSIKTIETFVELKYTVLCTNIYIHTHTHAYIITFKHYVEVYYKVNLYVYVSVLVLVALATRNH